MRHDAFQLVEPVDDNANLVGGGACPDVFRYLLQEGIAGQRQTMRLAEGHAGEVIAHRRGEPVRKACPSPSPGLTSTTHQARLLRAIQV